MGSYDDWHKSLPCELHQFGGGVMTTSFRAVNQEIGSYRLLGQEHCQTVCVVRM